MGRALIVLVVAFLFSNLPAEGLAQDGTDDEYRPVVREEVARLDIQEALGESYDPYTGLMTFLLFDVVEEGIGPPIRVGRTITVGDAQFSIGRTGEFGDWRIVLPMITTLAATDMDPNGRDEWIVDRFGRTNTYKRCSAFKAPPSEGGGPPKAWWYGVSLHDAYGHQEMVLKREEGTPLPAPSSSLSGVDAFPLLTKGGWTIGCLPGTSNGEAGEGFLAVDPAGNRYWFDHISFKDHHGFLRNSQETTRESRSRAFAWPSRIEDRFGNSLSFSYGNYGLVSIIASDGRSVHFDWIQGSTVYEKTYGLISKISISAADGSSRSYVYTYGSGGVGENEVPAGALRKIVRPDGSEWNFSTDYDAYKPAKYARSITGCLLDEDRAGGAFFQATSPSGLTARYELQNTRHGYSYAPAASCRGRGFFNAKSLRNVRYYGPGMDYSNTFLYGFDRSFASECALTNACADYTSTTIVSSDGSAKKIYSINRYEDAREGMPIRLEILDPQGKMLRKDEFEYADGINMGSSFVVGPDFSGTNPLKYQMVISERKRTISMDGYRFVRLVTEFDAIGRPLAVDEASFPFP